MSCWCDLDELAIRYVCLTSMRETFKFDTSRARGPLVRSIIRPETPKCCFGFNLSTRTTGGGGDGGGVFTYVQSRRCARPANRTFSSPNSYYYQIPVNGLRPKSISRRPDVVTIIIQRTVLVVPLNPGSEPVIYYGSRLHIRISFRRRRRRRRNLRGDSRVGSRFAKFLLCFARRPRQSMCVWDYYNGRY